MLLEPGSCEYLAAASLKDILLSFIDFRKEVIYRRISFLLQDREDLNVALIDPRADQKTGTWYPNYGEWRVEWEELSKRLDSDYVKIPVIDIGPT